MNLSSHVQQFEQRGHVVLQDVVAPGLLKMLFLYSVNYAKGGSAQSDELVPGTPAGYGHPCMERLLQQLVPTVSAATGRALFPTYSYFRVYRRGDVLPRHVDRPACEISVSLSLGYVGATDWPLWLHGAAGTAAASLAPGDGVIYKGIELEHWREPYTGESAAQVFLHYVDQAGPHADWRFDKRPNLRVGGAD